MEPVSIGLGGLAWEYGLKPVVDSIKKEYGESAKTQLKAGLAKVFDKLPFKKSELEIIEVEIVDAGQEVLTDKKKFLDFMQDNARIQELMNKVIKREPDINIVIEKSHNDILIDGNNNSIIF